MAHTAITEYLDHADVWLMRLNLLLLLFVAFLPFPTRLLAGNFGAVRAERVAATAYGLSLLVTSVLLYALWRYALRAGLVRPESEDADVKVLTRRLRPGLAGYGTLIVVGLFVPLVAVVGYLAIALFYLLPLGFRRRAGTGR